MARFFKTFIMIFVFTCFFCVKGAPLSLAEENTTTTQVTWAVAITKAPNPVRAFGFDIIYPVDCMSFEKFEKGELLQNGFGYFGVNEISPGRVRVGGMEPGDGFIKQDTTGNLVILTFKVLKDCPAKFQIIATKDEMKGWQIAGGNKKLATKNSAVFTFHKLEEKN